MLFTSMGCGRKLLWRAVVARKQIERLFRGDRARIEESLGHFAAELLKLRNLFDSFCPFGNNLKAHAMSQRDDEADDLEAIAVVIHGCDEDAVDLQGVHRETPQSAE